VEVYVSSILRLCTHASEYESGRANLRNKPQSYVERAGGELDYKFSCVSECVNVCFHSSMGDFVGRKPLCVWKLP
jgi:hypothetical protein